MSSSMDKLAKDLYKIIRNKEDKKPKSYSTKATVSKIEDGVMWVRFSGNDFDTPVTNTVEASPGDSVRVQVSKGRALALGNETAPSTDDTAANAANDNAEEAKLQASRAKAAADAADAEAQRAFEAADKAATDAASAAASAESAASDASIAASSAQTASESAQSAAENASSAADSASSAATDAESAAASAESAAADAESAADNAEQAVNAAETASYGLSLIQDVIGTMNWINEHGIYVVSTDTSVQNNKPYYSLIGTAIDNPTGNPNRNSYYEYINNVYVLSTDTTVDSQKTYYRITSTRVLDPTGDPSTNPYYELIIDEAITQYINMHLTLTESGLRISDGSLSYVLINSTDGVSIYNNNNLVAQYGEGAIIGNKNSYHIEIIGNRLSFMNGTGSEGTEIAYMTNNELYIPRVVVVDSMQIGPWMWDSVTIQYHLTLKWKGGGN